MIRRITIDLSEPDAEGVQGVDVHVEGEAWTVLELIEKLDQVAVEFVEQLPDVLDQLKDQG